MWREGLDSGTSPSFSMVPTPRSEALPAKAAEKQKLVGCTVLRPHARGKIRLWHGCGPRETRQGESCCSMGFGLS